MLIKILYMYIIFAKHSAATTIIEAPVQANFWGPYLL